MVVVGASRAAVSAGAQTAKSDLLGESVDKLTISAAKARSYFGHRVGVGMGACGRRGVSVGGVRVVQAAGGAAVAGGRVTTGERGRRC
jgi:hypothetical protein